MAKYQRPMGRWAGGQVRRAGMGGAHTVALRLPRAARRAASAPTLSDRARFRLRCVEHAHRAGVSAAVEAFGVSRATVYRWRRRYDPRDLRSLEDRSRRPRTVRKATWTPAQAEAVLALRTRDPRMGKTKLAHLLAAGTVAAGGPLRLSASMVGRILASLRRRNVLREPHAVRVRRRVAERPYATRVPADQRRPTHPGQLVQLDTLHLRPVPGVARRQFTAVDVASRHAVVGVRASASAGTAAAFLDELVARMPVPVAAIQVDGGSEFMAGFETACRDRGIALYVLPPRSPKLNGRVERRNGTSRREFWEVYDGDLDLPSLTTALRAWEVSYNTERPHQALGYATPAAHLAALLSHMS